MRRIRLVDYCPIATIEHNEIYVQGHSQFRVRIIISAVEFNLTDQEDFRIFEATKK